MLFALVDNIVIQFFDYNDQFWGWLNNHLGPWISQHLGNILVILLISWLVRRYGSRLAMRFISSTVRHDLYPTEADRKKRIRTLQSVVTAIFRVGTWAIAGLLIISEVRPSYAGTLFASAGIIGVAIGFGAQT